jgi:hypothetical protein
MFSGVFLDRIVCDMGWIALLLSASRIAFVGLFAH